MTFQSHLFSALPWVLICLFAVFIIFRAMRSKYRKIANDEGVDETNTVAPIGVIPRRRLARRRNGLIQLAIFIGMIVVVVSVLRHGRTVQQRHEVEASGAEAVLSDLRRSEPDFRNVHYWYSSGKFEVDGKLKTNNEISLLRTRLKAYLHLDDSDVDQIFKVQLAR